MILERNLQNDEEKNRKKFCRKFSPNKLKKKFSKKYFRKKKIRRDCQRKSDKVRQNKMLRSHDLKC